MVAVVVRKAPGDLLRAKANEGAQGERDPGLER
jgi:hypothetical protein